MYLYIKHPYKKNIVDFCRDKDTKYMSHNKKVRLSSRQTHTDKN